MRFRVVPVPCLSDNYAYLVVCEETKLAAIVDPGEPGPILAAIAHEGVQLAAIWLTHHHPDHVGGVDGVCHALGSVEVIAHRHDESRVPRVSRLVEDGETIALGNVRAAIIHNPGHTLGAISYFIAGAPGAVFTGDTLFAAGCGRLFEGTAEMMWNSLQRLTALPAPTRVYFGHEYTAANLRFAATVEPDNQAITARAEAVGAARAEHQPTTPSTILDELETNPFVRADDAAALATIRARKDVFR